MQFHRRLTKNASTVCSFTSQAAQKYTQCKVYQWLHAAMQSGASIDDSFFSCLEFAQNDLYPMVRSLIKVLESEEIQSFGEERRAVLYTEVKTSSPKRCVRLFEDIWMEYPILHAKLQKIFFHDEKCIECSIPREVKKARASLTEHLGCTEDMLDFLEFVYVLRTNSVVENYFEDTITIHTRSSVPLLAKVLRMTEKRLRRVLTEAYSCGFMQHSMGEYFHTSHFIGKFWDVNAKSDLDNIIYKKFPEKSLSLDSFHVPDHDKAHILHLLSCPTDEPIHILFYGAAGTGKTSFAHSLAAQLEVKAWAVASLEESDENDRRAALVACTRLAAKQQGAFVLLDEAERLLDTSADTFFGRNGTKDKAWLNSFLEQKGRRVIWITNSIDHVDMAVRRRFAYSLHFEALSCEQRQVAWGQIIQDEKAALRISQDEVKALVKKYPVPVAAVAKAVRQAKLLKYKKGEFAQGVDRILAAHTTLELSGKKMKKAANAVDEGYTLDGVTLERGQQQNLESMMRKVRKLDSILKENAMPKGAGSMLFYGPPGTGKSALAQYMAQELGRECVVKKASDLLSAFVGEAEKNIAQAFQSAEDNGDILVIDEADSFIYSRESAARSWEVTLVNEFLTQLEAFRGICICTSNRRESMDMAAMRRFSFKVSFAYAQTQQLEHLYSAILAPLCENTWTAKEKSLLLSCKHLTPGDFSAVRLQFWLEDNLTHTTLINALMREQKTKLDGDTKALGF